MGSFLLVAPDPRVCARMGALQFGRIFARHMAIALNTDPPDEKVAKTHGRGQDRGKGSLEAYLT